MKMINSKKTIIATIITTIYININITDPVDLNTLIDVVMNPILK